MKKWLIAAVAALIMVGCSSNTAGLRIDGESQTVLFGDNVLAGRLQICLLYTSDAADEE